MFTADAELQLVKKPRRSLEATNRGFETETVYVAYRGTPPLIGKI